MHYALSIYRAPLSGSSEELIVRNSKFKVKQYDRT